MNPFSCMRTRVKAWTCNHLNRSIPRHGKRQAVTKSSTRGLNPTSLTQMDSTVKTRTGEAGTNQLSARGFFPACAGGPQHNSLTAISGSLAKFPCYSASDRQRGWVKAAGKPSDAGTKRANGVFWQGSIKMSMKMVAYRGGSQTW